MATSLMMTFYRAFNVVSEVIAETIEMRNACHKRYPGVADSE